MKKIFWIASSWLFIFSLGYGILEFTALRWMPYIFPLASVVGYLDPDAQILAQYSKRGVTPENYIAILGDSYAFGQGDWLLEKQRDVAPTYNTTQLLHAKTGRDVVSFGRPASSSIKSYLEDPLSQLTFIRSLHRYIVADPEIAILYFYEGNDVVDNWKEFTVRYQGQGYDSTHLNEYENFSLFIDNAILHENHAIKKSDASNFTDRLLFGRFMVSLIRGESLNLLNTVQNKINPKPNNPIFKPQPRDHNTVIVAGNEQKIPDGLQVPPVALQVDEITTSMAVLDQSLQQLKKRWPNTRLGMVYIPAVGTAYHIISDTVNIYDKERGKTYNSSLLLPTSDATCQAVQKIANNNEIYFLDSRPDMRQTAQQQFVHGPVDWLHFNEAGYRVLADEIATLMAQMDAPRVDTGCANLAANSSL